MRLNIWGYLILEPNVMLTQTSELQLSFLYSKDKT